MGSLFILVVVAFPNGLAGIYRRHIDPLLDRVLPKRARPGADHRLGREPGARRLGRGIGARPWTRTRTTCSSVEGLTVSFDGFRAVDDLSFYLDRNEIRVIIGPNGAGKTTVLDLICGRTKATAGSVSFKGQELTADAEHEIVRAGVGRKFQTPSIYEDLTVFENLEISYPRGRSVFGALAFRRDAAVRERVEEVAHDIFLPTTWTTWPSI